MTRVKCEVKIDLKWDKISRERVMRDAERGVSVCKDDAPSNLRRQE